ncbi:adenylosuccinate lyase [Candidatus Micrarchaeota archaeon]|nr:adenylosuccinate lyase [Candidatus Micrarchaeota archaeon]
MAMMDISTEGEHIVHPIDSRYKVEEMNRIWEEENQLQKMLDVEAALSLAISEMKPELVSPDDARVIKENATITKVKLSRTKQIESEIHHDVMAVVKALAEQSGEAGGKIHLGATSADITETAKAMLVNESIDLILEDSKKLLEALVKRTEETKDWVCIDRTHGQHAVPTTYGFKIAGYLDQVGVIIERLEGDKKYAVGKIAGAVGTANSYTELGLDAIVLEREVLKSLGVQANAHSRQLPPRDNFLFIMSDLTIYANILDKIAGDLWNLCRTEIGEVTEATSSKQVGSSTMPHKKNPFRLERVMGMSAILRGDLVTEFELNFSHARDLKQSAPYRYRYPEFFITLDYMIRMMTNLITFMKIDKQKAYDNVFFTKGSVMAERVMTELAESGMDRQAAHERVKQLAWKAMSENKMLVDFLLNDAEIAKYLSEDKLRELMNPETYLGIASLKTQMIIDKYKR